MAKWCVRAAEILSNYYMATHTHIYAYYRIFLKTAAPYWQTTARWGTKEDLKRAGILKQLFFI